MHCRDSIRLLALLATSACFGTTDEGDSVGPLVQITKPSASTVTSLVDFAVSAVDESGVQVVEFFVDNVRVATDNSQPFETVWDSATSGDGPVILRATAQDFAGNQSSASKTVTVRNLPDPS